MTGPSVGGSVARCVALIAEYRYAKLDVAVRCGLCSDKVEPGPCRCHRATRGVIENDTEMVSFATVSV